MTRRTMLLASLAAVSAMASGAAEYYFKEGATDWSAATSFCTDSARQIPATSSPQADDVVILCAGTTFELDSESPSFSVFANLSVVRMAEGATLAITVASGRAEAKPSVRAGSAGTVTTGTVVKKGAGELVFTCADQLVCPNNLDVREGKLSITPDTTYTGDYFFGNIRVAGGATLSLPWSRSSSSRSNFHSINVEPGGFVINETTRAAGHDLGFHYYSTAARPASVISGTMSGNMRLWANGDILLNGTNATQRPVIATQGGIASVSSFAVDSESPLGSDATLRSYSTGGGFAYAGTQPETVTRDFEIRVGANGFATIGAGAAGMTFAGDWIPTREDITEGVRRLTIDGTNQTAAVMSGDIRSLDYGGKTYPLSITKNGSGVWRMDNSVSRFYPNVWRVLGGSLQFESLSAKGVPCSLGTSTILTEDSSSAIADSAFVPYSFLLGGGADDAILENVSSSPAVGLGRTVALSGNGGHLRSSTEEPWEMDGVSAIAAATPTLTLDGTGANPSNIVKNITDGANGAKVSVVKDGTGTWRIGGALTFSGSLTVKGGSLAIDNPQGEYEQRQFDYYRISFAQIGSGGKAKDYCQIRQIGLYDRSGNRLNGSLTALLGDSPQAGQHVAYVPAKIPAGCAGYDAAMSGHIVSVTKAGEFGACFNETSGYQSPADAFGFKHYDKNGVEYTLSPNDSNSWVRIVMHLPEGSAPVNHFDVQGVANSWDYLPSRLKLEGSCDGIHWTEVWGNVESGQALSEHVNITQYNCWLSDATNASNDSHARPATEGRWNLAAASGDFYKPFSWFRLSFAQIGEDGNTSNYLRIREICLFDRFGNRQNDHLKPLVDPATALPNNTHAVHIADSIGPGEVGYDPSAAGHKVVACPDGSKNLFEFGGSFTNLFGTNDGVWDMKWLDGNGKGLNPTPSDRSTWIPIVMHLPDGFEPVTHFDIQGFNTRDLRGNWPTRLMLEGSCDGVHWTVLHDNATKGAAFDYSNYGTGSGYAGNNNNLWLSDGGYCTVTGSACYHKRLAGDGSWALPTSWEVPEGPYDQLANATVQVSSGSLTASSPIEIKSFRIDACAQGGTLDNFVFAASGTLDVVAGKAAAGILPGSYANCNGVENLANWALTLNGRPTQCTVSFRDGKLTLNRQGLLLILR